MTKKEFIERYGEQAYKKKLEYGKVYIGSSNNLSSRFRKLGIPNPSREAKKYLIS